MRILHVAVEVCVVFVAAIVLVVVVVQPCCGLGAWGVRVGVCPVVHGADSLSGELARAAVPVYGQDQRRRWVGTEVEEPDEVCHAQEDEAGACGGAGGVRVVDQVVCGVRRVDERDGHDGHEELSVEEDHVEEVQHGDGDDDEELEHQPPPRELREVLYRLRGGDGSCEGDDPRDGADCDGCHYHHVERQGREGLLSSRRTVAVVGVSVEGYSRLGYLRHLCCCSSCGAGGRRSAVRDGKTAMLAG